MQIARHIREDYTTVDALAATASIDDLLVEQFFLVVEESGEFKGILTAADIAESPRKLVIDCLHDIPQLHPADNIYDVVQRMRDTKRLVLPVMNDGHFKGVAIYCDLVDYISRDNKDLQNQLSDRNMLLNTLNRELRQAVDKHERTYTELQIKEAAVENSIDGIAVSVNRRIVYTNPAMARLLEVDAPEDLIGQCGTMYAHPDFRDKANRAIDRVLVDKELIAEIELPVITPKGNERIFSLVVIPIDYDGDRASMTISHDITEKKRAEQERKLQEESMHQIDKMIALGTLVAGVAHEINNPNSSILGDAENLERIWQGILPAFDEYTENHPDFAIGAMSHKEIREQIPRILSGIRRSGNRIGHIVRKLRDFAMPATCIEREEVDLNAVVQSALELVRQYTEWATDCLEVDLPEVLPIFVGKRQELEHMVVNLVLNACEALTARQQKVKVTTRTSPGKDAVILTVSDQGTGIAEEAKSRVFDPFFTTKRDKGGTGLGLAIVRTIVLEHGGEIAVESSPGCGTAFTVTLPLEASK